MISNVTKGQGDASKTTYPPRRPYPSLGPTEAAPQINTQATESIKRAMYHKATTPEERAERFARLAAPRVRRAIRATRLVGDLVTGYAAFNDQQAAKICQALYDEVTKLQGKLESHLTKGAKAEEIEFDL